MATWLKRLLWMVAVFAVVWLAVIIYWQGTARMPSGLDLALYMGVVPLVLFGAGWALHSVATSPPAKPVATPTATPEQGAAVAAQANQKLIEQERSWSLGIVACALHTPSGASAAEVMATLQEGSVPQVLDEELITLAGFPVFAARVADMQCTPTEESLAQWQLAGNAADLAWSPRQYRALHLAALALEELASKAVEHPAVQQYAANLAAGRRADETAVLPLRLILLWPGSWSAEHQAAASTWAHSLVVGAGWPAQRVLVQANNAVQQDPIALLDFVTVTAHKAQLPTVGLLVACDSGIDQDFVDALQEKDMLYGGKSPQGVRPGELAAGLLFADAQQCQLLGEGPFAQLHRASWSSRDKSADAKGRTSSELLTTVANLALETAKLVPEDIAVLCADNDHKSSREAELAEVLNARFAELDATKDVMKVAQVSGSLQHVNTAATLCVAHQYVMDAQLPTLCMSLHDPLWRAAVVLSVLPDVNGEGTAAGA